MDRRQGLRVAKGGYHIGVLFLYNPVTPMIS